ncbi:hypothetical protein F5J12DRAFT_890936 [Pisolithus orientalis]|uniref:uncharacterized protein n=1 Tax=Pisolithus orientalis TaxID=936130 RepID=UPI0022248119|nr:uncharacterized protein F5J12DRAFT_890936 [Pisolithus orientalis]KAI6012612.1 hypothetical protein F5J12DRAFT_890936 [Pisolithus orientalis]
MAIGKWNPFAQQVPATQDIPLPTPVPIPSPDGKQFGFENFGNTCYANSVLQALYFCVPFRELLINHPDPYASLHQPLSPQCASAGAPTSTNSSVPPRRKSERRPTLDTSTPNGASLSPAPPIPSSPRTLFSALRSLYIHIAQNPADKGTVAPRAFIEKLREINEAFRSTMHQDAHEFLNYLLNRIVEEVQEERKNRLASAEDFNSSSDASQSIIGGSSSSASHLSGGTFVHQIFEGSLTSETRCLTCENVSSRDESFLDLSIDIEQNSSVTACLRQFSASEMLCQRNKFFCDACCGLQEAEKRMKIKQLPNVLALHLKRFKYQEDVQKYIKLTYRVAFPFELRLFNTIDDVSNPDRLYKLFAIVVHIGSGPNHGHYVSIIKTMDTWLVFDDDTVDTIKESDIPKYFGESNSGSAYVLYYQAADLDLVALGLRPPSLEQDSPSSISKTLPSHPPGLHYTPREASAPSLPSSPPPVSPLSPQGPPVPTPAPAPKSPRKTPSQLLRINLGSSSSTPHVSTIGSAAMAEAISPKRNGILRPARPTAHSNAAEAQSDSPGVFPTVPVPKEDPASHELATGNASAKEKDEKRIPSWFRKRSFRSIGKLRPNSEADAEPLSPPPDILLGTLAPLTPPPVPAFPASRNVRGISEPLTADVALRSNHGRPSVESAAHVHKETPQPFPAAPYAGPTTAHASPPSDRNTQHRSHGEAQILSAHNEDTTAEIHTRPWRIKHPPVPPPLPARLAPIPHHQGGHIANGDTHVSPHTVKGTSTIKSSTAERSPINGRPKSAHAFNVPLLPSAAASTPETGFRRARRKLSLSAPMLGFGKKDKQKERERER